MTTLGRAAKRRRGGASDEALAGRPLCLFLGSLGWGARGAWAWGRGADRECPIDRQNGAIERKASPHEWRRRGREWRRIIKSTHGHRMAIRHLPPASPIMQPRIQMRRELLARGTLDRVSARRPCDAIARSPTACETPRAFVGVPLLSTPCPPAKCPAPFPHPASLLSLPRAVTPVPDATASRIICR